MQRILSAVQKSVLCFVCSRKFFLWPFSAKAIEKGEDSRMSYLPWEFSFGLSLVLVLSLRVTPQLSFMHRATAHDTCELQCVCVCLFKCGLSAFVWTAPKPTCSLCTAARHSPVSFSSFSPHSSFSSLLSLLVFSASHTTPSFFIRRSPTSPQLPLHFLFVLLLLSFLFSFS
jgi:hypothetical protein